MIQRPFSEHLRSGFAILAVALMLAAGCTGSDGTGAAPAALQTNATLTIHTADGPVVLHVAVAKTEDARRTGLMGRRHLEPAGGMAFLFDGPTDGPFWMKGTLIPLQVAFWAADGRIVAMREMTPCRTDPCPYYFPHVTYVGAMEANAGFFTTHGVRRGDTVVLVH